MRAPGSNPHAHMSTYPGTSTSTEPTLMRTTSTGRSTRHALRTALFAGGLALLTAIPATSQKTITLAKIGDYSSGIFAQGGAEIVVHDPRTQRLFATNAQANRIDVIDARIPASPVLLFSIDLSPYGAGVNSVAVDRGLVAVAVENANKQANGKVVFFNTNGTYIADVTVGALPDMVTFTPNGKYLLVANEGEPSQDYTVDPEGSISIIDVDRGCNRSITQSDVRTATFTQFNNATLDRSVRIFGPNATVAQDFEPEYITVSRNSHIAWVTLQENNAIAIVDIKKAEVKQIVGLGFKDHNVGGNGLDASDKDNTINIANWPVLGMYLPDAIASFHAKGDEYLITANEGDAREYTAFDEQTRVGSVTLDLVAFPNGATLKATANLGRLRITKTLGDSNHDGKYEQLYSFGARSFSIWSDHGALIFDSGDQLERITAAAYPADFNSTHDASGSFDTRSDDKGPEPEGVAVGKVKGHLYAFICLERIGGIMVYDIDDPTAPAFVQYLNTRIFSGNPALGTAGDLGPEAVHFVEANDSPTRNPLLIVGHEVSGTTVIYEVTPKKLGKQVFGEPSDDAIDGGYLSMLGDVAPNPTTGLVTIPFSLAIDARATITLLDLSGRTVATITDMDYAAGTHQANADVTGVPAGTYFCRLDLNGVVSEMHSIVVQH